MKGKIVISQLGARMHYAVPRIFSEQGKLARFYTDICATQGWPRLVGLLPKALLPAAVRRLVGRRPKGIAPDLVVTFPEFGARSALRRMRVRSSSDETAHAIWAASNFSALVCKRGFAGADGLYTFSGDGLEQMRAAKRLGLWRVMEQMIAPRDVVDALIAREAHLFPEWADPLFDNPYAKVFAAREKAEWELADLILCPSEFVRKHVLACGGPAGRCALVPYGVDPSFPIARGRRRPGPLRVLTVGEVGLRKGSPYVAEAARLVGRGAVFRMCGKPPASPNLRAQLQRSVELRGIVARQEIARDFEWADLFLLPSICEGSATVTYEALAAGLPVIATDNTGSVVRDGIEGFIVPTGDSEAIALAVERLASDEALRADLAANAARRAEEFTVSAYSKRLVEAITRMERCREQVGRQGMPVALAIPDRQALS